MNFEFKMFDFDVAAKDYPVVLENYVFVMEARCSEYDDEALRLYRRKKYNIIRPKTLYWQPVCCFLQQTSYACKTLSYRFFYDFSLK